jgi:hypothetical protein
LELINLNNNIFKGGTIMFSSNYSLADVAAATGSKDDGLFGNNGWWIILLFLFTGGGWGGRGGSTTREEISYGFSMNNLENSVRGIQQGLCDGFYAMNTGMLNGFAGVNQAITADTIANMQHTNILENQVQAVGTQMASCCCDLKTEITRGFADLGYALATQSCETRRAITDSTRAILDFLTQDKIASLTAENQNLKFAASQQAQNAYLVNAIGPKYPIPAYVVPNPYSPTTTTTGA